MKSKKVRRASIALCVITCFLAALFVFLCIWWFGARHPEFDRVARKEIKIPGLESGISPQGICTLPENEMGYDFAMSGYIAGEPSRVYFIDADGTSGVKYLNFTKDGMPISTHFGGLTCSEEYLYIASGDEIIRSKLSDVFGATYGSRMEIRDSFKTGFDGNAFCYIYDEQLYVGEFYRPGNYETDPSHHIEVNGKKNHAFVFVFDLDKDGFFAPLGPTKIISIPDQVQGIAVTKEKIYLSTSYGLPDSKLYVYENKLNGEPDDDISPIPEVSSSRPLYILEPKAADLVMPCMSEEICVKDGRLYILFESMSKKYRMFVRTRLSNIYSIALEALG